MFCRKCGANIDDNSKFCSNCGNTIDSTNVFQYYNEEVVIPENNQPVNNELHTQADFSAPIPNTDPTPQPAPVTPQPVINQNYNPTYNSQNFTQPNYNAAANQAQVKPKGKTGFAVASLILAILSLPACCCNIYVPVTPILPLFAILAIIFGILGLKSRFKGMAIVGIILGGLGILMYVVMILYFYLTPSGQEFQRSLWEQFNKAMENAQSNY